MSEYDISALLHQLRAERERKYKGGIYYFTQTELAYNSNRIEGSRLSREHTRNLFETKTLIAAKDEAIRADDVVETMNHFRAFDHVLSGAEEALTEEFIKHLHFILKAGTSDAGMEWFRVGEYKKVANIVGGHETSAPEDVPRDIRDLLERYEEASSHDIDSILAFHERFESIHPFQDGNGRVGRLILFKECLRQGVVPFIIDSEHKDFYYRGLRMYHEEKGYLRDTCLSAQDKYTAYCTKMVPGFLKEATT